MVSKRRVQEAKLLTKHPSDNQQRVDQNSQLGEVLDQLLDPRLELQRPDHAHLETEVAQGGAKVAVDGERLRLQQLAMGEQHSQFLTAYRLHMTKVLLQRTDGPYIGLLAAG